MFFHPCGPQVYPVIYQRGLRTTSPLIPSHWSFSLPPPFGRTAGAWCELNNTLLLPLHQWYVLTISNFGADSIFWWGVELELLSSSRDFPRSRRLCLLFFLSPCCPLSINHSTLPNHSFAPPSPLPPVIFQLLVFCHLLTSQPSSSPPSQSSSSSSAQPLITCSYWLSWHNGNGSCRLLLIHFFFSTNNIISSKWQRPRAPPGCAAARPTDSALHNWAWKPLWVVNAGPSEWLHFWLLIALFCHVIRRWARISQYGTPAGQQRHRPGLLR